MGDVMSVHEYTTALTSLRRAQSDLMGLELAATRRALAQAQTSQGRVEMRRRANTKAARLLRTAVEAERIAKLEALKSASIEPESLGRARLINATAEVLGIRPDQVKHHRDKRPPREPTTPKSEGPKRNRGRPRTTEHGFRMYQSGACRCAEICRPANAAHKREERAKAFQPKTICANGHPKTDTNVYAAPDGSKRCKDCRREVHRKARKQA